MSSRGEQLTEEELLGDSGDVNLDNDLDEDALLDDIQLSEPPDSVAEKLPTKETSNTQEFSIENESHHEELDYEDDDETEEDKETRSKFSSERAKGSSSVSSSGVATSNSAISVASSLSAAPDRKGHQQTQNLPSLLRMDVKPPPILPGGKILVNPNFVPPQQQPLVRLTLPGAPTIAMPPPLPMAPIIPRLPNGTPLFGLPSNHGVAGFGPPPMPIPPIMGGGQWDHRVAAFLSNVHRRRRRRSSSYSSYSSSSSSHSRSRSRSRGSSRSPRRKRHSSSHRRERRSDDKHYRSDRRGGRRDDRDRRSRRDNGSSSKNRSEKEVTEECAKVVGVDSEYLSKVEEQKKKREELVRKKEQRRYGGGEEDKTKEKVKPVEDDYNKKKAYLCVTIRNMSRLENAPDRIEKLATEMGAITKCWRFADDQVNLIFKDHYNAKGFLLKYNNKVLSGIRMQISLEKAFFNLSEIK